MLLPTQSDVAVELLVHERELVHKYRKSAVRGRWRRLLIEPDMPASPRFHALRAAVAVAVTVSMGAYLVSRFRGVKEEAAVTRVTAERLALRAEPIYARLDTVSLDPLRPDRDHADPTRAIASIRSAYQSASRAGDPAATDGHADALCELAAEFVYWRFVNDDPVKYRAWRASRSERFRPKEELTQRLYIPSDYESVYQEPFPGFEPAFDRMFTDSTRRGDGKNTPVGICLGPRGIRIAAARINPNIDEWPVPLGDESDREYWFGIFNGAMRNWFTSPTAFRDLYTRGDELLGATVATVMSFADGSRRPVMLFLYFDPAIGAWSIDKVATYNTPMDGISILEF